MDLKESVSLHAATGDFASARGRKGSKAEADHGFAAWDERPFRASPGGSGTCAGAGGGPRRRREQTSQVAAPGRSRRVLDLGTCVIFRERGLGSGERSVNLAYVDRSTVGLRPETDIAPAEYFYDPDARTGRNLMNLGKGVPRFVGGEISRRGTAEVRSPVGTVGVRGGAFTVFYDPATRTLRVISTYGWPIITTGLVTQRIDRPGFAVTIVAGKAPDAPVRSGPGDFDLPTRLIGSQPGQFGSTARFPPTWEADRLQTGSRRACRQRARAFSSRGSAGPRTTSRSSWTRSPPWCRGR